MNTFKIEFEDGNSIVTGFNGTLGDAENYYVGNRFNFGDSEEFPRDRMVKAVQVGVMA